MEESLSFIAKIRQEFACKEVDIRTYSPLTLAYIGDSIYDVIIRTVVVARGNQTPQKLHKKTVNYVNAGIQARMIEALQADLTEEEMAVYLRGRNAKSYTTAKNASVIDYRKATGMEAMIGYLYLKDDMKRILELIQIGLHKVNLEL